MWKLLLLGTFMFATTSPIAAKDLVLGDKTSELTWIYLCGLADHFDASNEIENRETLNRIGKKLKVRFLAIHPFDRCEPAQNKLCWTHYTNEQALETYKKITKASNGFQVKGFIGFSNGGYFLNTLVQLSKLNAPIISIGSAGTFISGDFPNDLTLIVGKEELTYNSALEFCNKANNTRLSVKFIEHDGDHILPEKPLEEVIKNLS